jgi:Undecaprenyl-phosphate galactose phosphotransferase WbaP
VSEATATLSDEQKLVERRAHGAKPVEWSPATSVLTKAALVIADAIALTVAFGFVVIVRGTLFDSVPPLHWGLWTALASWFLFRAALELYTPHGLPPPEELRRSFHSSVAAGVSHFAILVSSGEWEGYRLIGLLVWVVVLPLTFTARSLIRTNLIKRGQYGVPVAIIGNGTAGRRAIRELKARPEFGYIPVALFGSEKTAPGEQGGILGVPLVGRTEAAPDYNFPYRVSHAMLAVGAGWQDDRNHELAQRLARRFVHLQIFSNLVGQGQWLARARPIGPYLAIETRNARFTRGQQLLKRLLDISISLPAVILSAPIVLIAGLAVKIGDPGPAFFSQTREGRGGKPIKIYKLRSMVVGAEAKLAEHLASNEEARFEYERTMKIRNDPRIIPGIGRLVRKTSIDELPQLWSILKGDMSLVGPRVMPTWEIELYSGSGRELRRDMLPGLTGFWQVEHRNDSDFQIREIADSFYVANWSVWLDLWIILRTVRVVLTGSGAF